MEKRGQQMAAGNFALAENYTQGPFRNGSKNVPFSTVPELVAFDLYDI